MTRLSDHERAQSTVTLSAEQFEKLVELLTPGYELAKMYLAQAHKPTESKAEEVEERKADAS